MEELLVALISQWISSVYILLFSHNILVYAHLTCMHPSLLKSVWTFITAAGWRRSWLHLGLLDLSLSLPAVTKRILPAEAVSLCMSQQYANCSAKCTLSVPLGVDRGVKLWTLSPTLQESFIRTFYNYFFVLLISRSFKIPQPSKLSPLILVLLWHFSQSQPAMGRSC